MDTPKTNKIAPCLWFDDQGKEAAEFYISLFANSGIETISRYGKAGHEIHGQPEGRVMTVEFALAGQTFTALNGGPHFTPNPSISFFLNFDPSHNEQARKQLQETWEKFTSGGKVLMELGEYPFSSKYGWVQDQFGVSWQLILSNPDGEDRPFIVPSLMFCNGNNNRAEEAINFYTAVFNNSGIGNIARYPEDTGPAKEGSIMYGDFMIENMWIAAMDSGTDHDFNFNEAISLVVNCETQDEIDYYWERLSAVPAAEQCGWLKDKYGVSWQVVPSFLDEMFAGETTEKSERIMEAMLHMKKLDIKTLKQAY